MSRAALWMAVGIVFLGAVVVAQLRAGNPAAINDPALSRPVHVVEVLRDNQALRLSITGASKTLAQLGLTLHADVSAVTVQNRSDTDLYYNPVGAATSANAAIVADQAYTMYGDATSLALVQFLAASDTVTADVIEHIVKQAP